MGFSCRLMPDLDFGLKCELAAGILGLLHTVANEWGPFQIRVNAVCPGLIRTLQQVPLGRGGQMTAKFGTWIEDTGEFRDGRWRPR